PEIDEVKLLTDSVRELQAVTDLPLQIDTSDAVAMEKALRLYNGKAMINSVNGKKESMDAVFPLVRKYGGLVVALTLDENGIPSKAEGRFEIAERILEEAKKYGIGKKDIVFDPLALTVSADGNAAVETLRAVEMIRTGLGCHTSLGVSNVSFGLPSRDLINGTFFALALGKGLSAAIMNPYSAEMMKTYFSYKALSGLDENCSEFIEFSQTLPVVSASVSAETKPSEAVNATSELQNAVIKGLKEKAAKITLELLKKYEPLEIVKEDIIPALNTVGEGFEKNKIFLPQLLMSAEAAKCAFEQIKATVGRNKSSDKCAFVLATVKGDIHDIGKNIVKLLLENYGFEVYDLGRDVSPEVILAEVIRLKAPIVGLSALMTTTVPAMEETIKLLRKDAPWCKIIVGGAVLTKEYADSIGADEFAKDAMETVRYAEKINARIKE
ncbi:MAG: dihydropteroate synthase, partial [Clostridia bacterium]|nr:dihydropteroate synthase [Clostridia bacterium]